MALSSKSLQAIQVAGASVFDAQAHLTIAVKECSAQVHASMLQNPFDNANDALYEEWKTVARLAQAMGQIESELQKIYAAASGIGSGGTLKSAKSRAISTPESRALGFIEVINEINATDVVPKKPHKLVKSAAGLVPKRPELQGNAAKVLAQLVKTLEPKTFSKINQSDLAVAVGIPKGSIGASMSRLVKEAYLTVDSMGRYAINTSKK